MALLGNLKGSAHVFPETEYYNNVGMTSVRFEDGSSTYLTKTFSSDGTGSGATCTISCWVKRANISNNDQWFFTAGSSSPAWLFGFRTADTLAFGDDDGNPFVTVTDRKFRDTSAWYHLVLAVKTSESSNADKYKIYVNGELQTSTFSGTAADTLFGANVVHNIGRYPTGSTYVDLYMSDLNFVDGLALDPTYFGESKNGVWIPKEPVVSEYGTNGFRFKFDQTGVGSGASNTIGADSSGKDNHFTSSGIAASDCAIPDNPENNFCTFNPIGRRYGQSYVGTFSEGNLKVASGGNATHVFGTMAINQIASQGGVYFEVRLDSQDTSRTYVGVFGDTGTNNKASNSNAASYSFPIKGLLRPSAPDGSMAAYFGTDTDGSGSTDLSSHVSTYSNGDILGVAILSDGKTFFHKNGTYIDDANGNVGNPSTGANPTGTIDLTKGDFVPYVGYNSTFSINFGQDSTFAGQESSGGNSDANGIGDFKYAVPTNCLALCTSNMAEPTIGPNSATQADDHFNTVLYTGNATDNRSITGFGLKPDWLWIKNRSNSASHHITDTSRGGALRLRSNNTNVEENQTDRFTSIDTDGFTITGSDSDTNANSNTYVAWGWKANSGTTSSDSNGSITSTVQANQTAGFSIVLYTGTGANATVGHGLGVAPQWIIMKRRDSSQNWVVYYEDVGNDRELLLNATDAQTNSNSVYFNNTSPTSTVFSLGSDNYANASSGTYVAYCFAEIEGYSKFGSYNGTGNADGTFIYTGFRPAWVIFKRTDSTNHWLMLDNKRNVNNVVHKFLLANESDAEDTSNDQDTDFTSNGFKVRNSNARNNASGGTYVYAAFAEAPFKYANGR